MNRNRHNRLEATSEPLKAKPSKLVMFLLIGLIGLYLITLIEFLSTSNKLTEATQRIERLERATYEIADTQNRSMSPRQRALIESQRRIQNAR